MAETNNSKAASCAFPGPLETLWHGAAYYPELWPDQSIERELQRVKRAGLSVVRIGEFAWSKMERSPGEFDFSVFEETLDRALEAGIAVVVGTPTATPPIWLTHGHPDRVIHDEFGTPMSHGGRQHLAIDHPFVRERCRVIVEAMVQALGEHPALIAWQVDNEFKCDTDADFGPSVRPVWENWLRERYETVERLNQAWGAGVWSQEYQEFGQVPFPKKCPGVHNASLLTAWKRFSRERIADFCAMQAKVIRKHSSRPITHNAGILFRANPELVMASMDFVSFDHYVESGNWIRMVVNYDYWRNLKPERRFWLMETSSGHNGSLLGFHKPHPPGFVQAEAAACYALGGAAFCYWVWRQQRSGAELAHGCLMQSWDSPAMGMKASGEVETARQELAVVLEGAELRKSEVALMWSDTGRIMLQTEPHNGLEYASLLVEWAKRMRAIGLHLDIVPEAETFEDRKLLFTPYLPAIPDAVFDRIERFVRAGGIWVAGPLTGGRTAEHTVHLDAGLGRLESIAGVRTAHSYPLGESGARGLALGCSVELTGWSYLFEPAGASLIGVVEGGPTPGLGFLSEFTLGEGKVVVLGAQPTGEAAEDFFRTLFSHYATECGTVDRFEVTAGTIVAPWRSRDEEILVCVNMDGEGGRLRLPESFRAENGDRLPKGETIELESYAYRIFRGGALDAASVSRGAEVQV